MFKYLPNMISIARIVCTPILAWLVYSRSTDAFAWLLLVAGVSDFVDGWIARRYNLVSHLGAMLDSVADLLLLLVTLFAIAYLHSDVVLEHGTVLWVFIATWACVHVLALIRYRKMASFHTLLTRVAIVLFGLFALLLFFYQFVPWLWYLAGSLGVLAGLENIFMILLLAEWKPNVREGLISVLRERRSD